MKLTSFWDKLTEKIEGSDHVNVKEVNDSNMNNTVSRHSLHYYKPCNDITKIKQPRPSPLRKTQCPCHSILHLLYVQKYEHQRKRVTAT